MSAPVSSFFGDKARIERTSNQLFSLGKTPPAYQIYLFLNLFLNSTLIMGNGVFAMSEIAVVSARKARLQQQANQGNMGARAALKLANSPSRFLATVQIGITLVRILAGAFGGATIAEKLLEALRLVPVLVPYVARTTL
ncbi:CNNM domain-containing protein [Myxacorys almedinensis]|uniref:CNNM domain-containing protein n=1 Tax=Myxacorys almedinensis TaxID=2651157 RepID=UPI001EE3D4FC|nr:CNNM domain-containing protein [Myxacorys almedinensis]